MESVRCQMQQRVEAELWPCRADGGLSPWPKGSEFWASAERALSPRAPTSVSGAGPCGRPSRFSFPCASSPPLPAPLHDARGSLAAYRRGAGVTRRIGSTGCAIRPGLRCLTVACRSRISRTCCPTSPQDDKAVGPRGHGAPRRGALTTDCRFREEKSGQLIN